MYRIEKWESQRRFCIILLKVLGELYHIYYNNRDLRLLLDLLATSSGIAPAIAIMTLFDKVENVLIFVN
jgi:hypothetical protein